ncbi:MAG: winged helix-turn-helix transcriptional regulator [Candidatus Riflebacteria bacterium]|nr:winged helix-turn-helix transcriptional regulator [Candidatus Riflebacteria bacterium]
MNNNLNLKSEFIPLAAEILKTLGHPLRLRIFEALSSGEKSVTELQNILGVQQSVVSHQLKILKSGGVISFKKDGTLSIYFVAMPELKNLLDCMFKCQLKLIDKFSPDRSK